MEVEPLTVLSTLPPRVRGSYLNNRQKVKVDTNLYKVNFDSNVTIGIYSVKFNPAIQYDNRSLRLTLLNKAMEEIKNELGQYVINGSTVYASYKKDCSKDIYNVKVSDGGMNYEVAFKCARKIDLNEIKNPDRKKSGVVYGFLNNLVKNFLMKLGYIQIGKSKKYYNHKMEEYLQMANVLLYQGYATSFNLLQSGLYLKVDSSTRVVQNSACLNRINDLYKMYHDLEKDQKRNRIKAEFIGQTVMANYGNHRYWKIQDVKFDTDTDAFIVNKDTNENLTQYYQERYKLKITKPKQPLLKAVLNQVRKKLGESQPKKQEMDILLVPEFCLMSGLPEDFDDRKRREVSQKTIIPAADKRKRIEDIVKKLNNNLPDFGPKSISKALRLTIEDKSEQMEAINLGQPNMALGSNNTIEKGKAAQFMLFNKPLYTSNTPLKIMIFCGQQVNVKQIEDLIYPTAKNFRVECKIKVQNIDYRDRKCLTDIEYFLEDIDDKYKDYNMFWFILPASLKNMYGRIKKTAMESRHPKLTQMTVDTTLSKKGFNSIITKILIQMACKVGNQPWLPIPPKAAGNKTMMIGIDTAADKLQKGTIVAYCANVRGDFSKFFSSYILQEGNKEIPEKTGLVVTNAMNEFYKANKHFPQELIILRNGCADSQISTALQQEVTECREAVSRMSKKDASCNPHLTYIIVDKNVSQKLFKSMGDKFMNAQYGTLVNNKITTNDYDFYMIAQKCGMGTVKPAYYKVIHSDSKVEEGILQDLLYTQCFNYMNWTGSVTVPACLQYAKKLSGLISGYVNNKDCGYFPANLYFI